MQRLLSVLMALLILAVLFSMAVNVYLHHHDEPLPLASLRSPRSNEGSCREARGQAPLWKARQADSLIEIRAIASACEMYAVDHSRYPEAASIEVLRSLIVPRYIADLPPRDPAGRFLEYRSDGKHYELRVLDSAPPTGDTSVPTDGFKPVVLLRLCDGNVDAATCASPPEPTGDPE